MDISCRGILSSLLHSNVAYVYHASAYKAYFPAVLSGAVSQSAVRG